MRVVKTSNYSELSQTAAIFIAAQMLRKQHSVLGLATGSTPEGLYSELVSLGDRKIIDFSEIRTFNLDEYYGLTKDHPQSYYYYMREKLFNYVNVKEENTHIPDGSAADPAEECERYENLIRQAGGIDLQLLGIGRNGHIGFNEPDDCFSQKTCLVDLTEDTLEANKRFFKSKEEMPGQALSMGINTIMQAKSILLVANGASKKAALDKMMNQPVTPQMPASVLQFHHNVTVMYCD